MASRKPAHVNVIKVKPDQGEMARQFCWHDRPGIEIQTEDGRVLATYHHKQLRPENPELWASYFRPGIVLQKK